MAGAPPKGGAKGGAGAPSLTVLLDVRLQMLPVEAAPHLSGLGVPLSRDFSVHMLASRAEAVIASAAAASAAGGGKGAPAAELAFENGDVAFVADPRNEDSGSANADKPRSTILSALGKLQQNPKTAGSWTEGVRGDDHIPDATEIMELLLRRGNGGFVFYGAGRSASHLPPHDLAGLNVEGCRVAMLVDRADNELTYRRQSKIDTQKKREDLALEEPLETAALWSLAGTGAVLLNQWSTSFHANRLLLNRVLDGLSDMNLTIGEALHYSAKAEEPLEDDVEDVPAPDKAGSRPGSGKSDKGRPGSGKGKKPATPNKDKGRASQIKKPLDRTPSNSTLGIANDTGPMYQLKSRVQYCPVIYGLPTFRLKA